MPTDANQAGGSRQLTSNEFRDVIGHFASGVTVITVSHDGQPHGSTASAVSSLSLEPPMVLVCMNKSSSTGQAIAAARAFAINVLNDESDELAQRFATKGADKFGGTPVIDGPHGQPLLADALATIECDVKEAVTGGTHTVFLGEVRSATSHDGAPLAYFRGEFGRLELARDRHIYMLIRERLLARELPIGRELELAELATGLDVPAGPLYYALGRLSSEGMLERTREGGFVVPPVTFATLSRAIDANVAIELGAIDLSIGNVSEDDLAAWQRAMEATLVHVEPGHFIDLDSSIDANSVFHDMLIGFTGAEPLLSAYHHVALPGILARAFEPRVSATETDIGYGQDHRDIFEAFVAEDAPAAREAVLRHGARIKEAFRSGLAAIRSDQ